MGKNKSDELGVEYEKLIEEDNLEFLREYFPDQDNILQKGRLESKLPTVLSTVEMLPELYKELSGFEDFIDEWINKIEQRKISVNGKSRGEFENILSSLVASTNLDSDRDKPSSEGFKEYFKSRRK